MRQSAKSFLVFGLATLAVAALVWLLVHDTASQQYSVRRADLTGWTVVASQGAEPWVLGAQPPATLMSALVRQLSASTGLALVPVSPAVLPLVLRAEYDDALQGVYGIDALQRMARDLNFERATFDPICVAHRSGSSGSGQRQLFYLAFNSAAFRELREELLPAQPEHGGIGVYDPAALLPLLPIAASDDEFEQWWPLTFDRRTDCQAPLLVE
jgi:hypothetical protein